jgi:hypothetical protein
MTKRKPVSIATKRAVIEGAHGRCEKCHLAKPLALHHIVAYGDGGEDASINLAALCERCHTEHHALEKFVAIPFTEWLTLPPLGILIELLRRPDIWPEETSARQFRAEWMRTYANVAAADLSWLDE